MRGMINGKPIEGKVSIAVLFDPVTGDIVHVHRVIKFGGHKNITPEYVLQRARDLYARTGRDGCKLKAITVDPAEFKLGSRYKVDVATSAFVEIDVPK
jgi:hypothetical protein